MSLNASVGPFDTCSRCSPDSSVVTGVMPGVPKTWPDDTYDYFWIIDFPPDSNVPSKFTMVKQEFGTSFPKVPSNDWGAPDGLDEASGCKAKD